MSIAVFSICIELLKPTSKNKKQQGRLMTIPGNACKIQINETTAGTAKL